MTFLSPVLPRNRPARQAAVRRTLSNLPADPAVLRRNVLDAYDRSTADERTQGHDWYRDAHDIALALPVLSSTVSRPDPTGRAGAGILAALSPQLGWSDNVAAAATLCATGGRSASPAGLSLGIERAQAIYRCARPEDVLGGRKVRSFYRNIADPTRPGPVTIDRHAIAIACGRPSVPDTEAKILERPGGYALFAGAYRSAARALSTPAAPVLPHELQAITWLSHRNVNAAAAAARDALLPSYRSDLSEDF